MMLFQQHQLLKEQELTLIKLMYGLDTLISISQHENRKTKITKQATSALIVKQKLQCP